MGKGDEHKKETPNDRIRINAHLSSTTQRAPKGPPNKDPPKSGLRVSACSFWVPSPHEAAVWPSAAVAQNMCSSIRMSSSLLKCLLLMVASVVKSPAMIRVTLLCGRALSERALWRLLSYIGFSELVEQNLDHGLG